MHITVGVFYPKVSFPNHCRLQAKSPDHSHRHRGWTAGKLLLSVGLICRQRAKHRLYLHTSHLLHLQLCFNTVILHLNEYKIAGSECLYTLLCICPGVDICGRTVMVVVGRNIPVTLIDLEKVTCASMSKWSTFSDLSHVGPHRNRWCRFIFLCTRNNAIRVSKHRSHWSAFNLVHCTFDFTPQYLLQNAIYLFLNRKSCNYKRKCIRCGWSGF